MRQPAGKPAGRQPGNEKPGGEIFVYLRLAAVTPQRLCPLEPNL
jgi:hypothetical protein